MLTHQEARAQISELIEEITRHAYLYYVQDVPVLSDAEYDALVQKLKTLEGAYPDLLRKDSPTQRVGAQAREEFSKITHLAPMQSLDNAFDIGDIRAFWKKLEDALGASSIDVFCEPKIDGLAVSIIYQDGLFTAAATRGDGKIGEDVTENVKTIRSLPLRLKRDLAGRLEVRGEVCIDREDFARLNVTREESGEPLFANPRNAAAGSLRQLDSHVTASRPLRVYLYHVENAEERGLQTQEQMFDWLKEIGLPVHGHSRLCLGVDEVLSYLDEWEKQRHEHGINTDGVVLKLNPFKGRELLGSTSTAPRWATAYKFPPEEKLTQVLDIEVSVGRTGTLTPTAILAPVHLSGTVVQRASLHNQDDIDRKDVRIGDWVWVHKAGEIIPEILRVDDAKRTGTEKRFLIPDSCPVCHAQTTRLVGEVAVRCTNKSCPAQIKEGIAHFASRSAMNIIGLGDKIVDQLVSSHLVTNLADLYTLNTSQLEQLDRMGKKSAKNLVDAIQDSKKRPYASLLHALGIRHVGVRVALDLATHSTSMQQLQQMSVEQLSAVDGVGPVIADSVVEFLKESHNIQMIEALRHAGVCMEQLVSEAQPPEKQLLKGIKIVFTGELESMSREDAAEQVRALGGETPSSVNKKTSYVVVGDSPGSKHDKALKLGVPVLKEEEFRKLLTSGVP